MGYIKQTFIDDKTVLTADMMKHIEQGLVDNETAQSTHDKNTTKHITAAERSAWNGKADASAIPIKTSQLTNDSNFVTKDEVEQGSAKDAVLYIAQELTEEQKAQARANIGAEAKKEDGNMVVTEVEYTYDGDRESDEHTWVTDYGGNKYFVKVGDMPDGKINLVGGFVNVTKPSNTYQDYSFEITEEMLDASVTYGSLIISASGNGLTQIFYQDTATGDNSPIALVIVCTRAGQYSVGFNGWGELLTFKEKGVYFMDNRVNGGNKYVESMACTIIETADSSDENPAEYQGNEIQVFTRGICIGDSITEGVFNHSEGEVTIKKHSYPRVLQRMTNIEVVNAGIAGLTSKTWYEASLNSETQWGTWVDNEWFWGTAESADGTTVDTVLDYSGYDFAVIHLGINDIGMMGSATLDATIATFETNINNIISKLKTESVGIKIFLCTIIPCYATNSNTAYKTLNDKIRELTNATDGVYLIDLNTYSECLDGTAYENQHLTALGYYKMASEITSLISYTVNKNLNDFKFVQFIGTEYTA